MMGYIAKLLMGIFFVIVFILGVATLAPFFLFVLAVIVILGILGSLIEGSGGIFK